MAFVNDFLKEEEIREYELKWPYTGEIAKFGVGVIDRERDIRLFQYANGPIMEPSDIYSFIFDYKSEVIYIDLRKSYKKDDGNTIYWYLVNEFCVPPSLRENKEEVKQALREAIETYGSRGMARNALEKEFQKKQKIYAKF